MAISSPRSPLLHERAQRQRHPCAVQQCEHRREGVARQPAEAGRQPHRPRQRGEQRPELACRQGPRRAQPQLRTGVAGPAWQHLDHVANRRSQLRKTERW